MRMLVWKAIMTRRYMTRHVFSMTCHPSRSVDTVEQLRYLVLAAQRDGNRALAARLRPLDLTPAQAEVLTVLAGADRPLTVRQIGEQLVCEPGSPSRLVASLVTAGLLAR